METATEEKEETTITKEQKGKGKWESRINKFNDFMACGGIILCLIAAVGILMIIGILIK